MEQVKKAKAPKSKVAMGNLRVKGETRRRVLTVLSAMNKKDFGRKVRVDDLVTHMLDLLQPESTVLLQNATLSNADRFNHRYANYCKQHGSLSRDEYLGKLLGGELTSQSQ